MNIKLLRSYKNGKGNTVFVYAVSGNQAQLEAFKTAQGDFHREDEKGNPLWFTTRCVGNNGKLVITSKGKVVPDMSEYEQAASLAKQFGGNFGQELAKASVAKIMGNPIAENAPAPRVEEEHE